MNNIKIEILIFCVIFLITLILFYYYYFIKKYLSLSNADNTPKE